MGAARDARLRKQRSLARHVGWLTGLVQSASSHHAASAAAAQRPGCSALQARMAAMEKALARGYHDHVAAPADSGGGDGVGVADPGDDLVPDAHRENLVSQAALSQASAEAPGMDLEPWLHDTWEVRADPGEAGLEDLVSGAALCQAADSSEDDAVPPALVQGSPDALRQRQSLAFPALSAFQERLRSSAAEARPRAQEHLL